MSRMTRRRRRYRKIKNEEKQIQIEKKKVEKLKIQNRNNDAISKIIDNYNKNIEDIILKHERRLKIIKIMNN